MEFLLLGALALFFGGTLMDWGSDDDAAPPPDDDDEPVRQGDTILGTDGNDTLSGDGDDIVRGGRGRDLIDGIDRAELRGGPGNDTISARDEAVAHGNSGDDTILTFDDAQSFGGDGRDEIRAYQSSTGHGGDGDDLLRVRGDATVHGEAGEDRIFFEQESNTGAAGFGGEGDDSITFFRGAEGSADGGAGDDRMTWRSFSLNGDLTADSILMTGGEGADTFEISDGGGRYSDVADEIALGTITDFDPDEDRLVVDLANQFRVVTDIQSEQIAGEDAVELRIDVADRDTLDPLTTLVLRVNGVSTLDVDAVSVLRGTGGDDVLTQTGGGGEIYGGSGDDTITVTDPVTATLIVPGTGADVVTVTGGADLVSIDAGDGDADVLNVESGASIVMDESDLVVLSVTAVGAPPVSIKPDRDLRITPEDVDLPLEIRLPDDWTLGRDLTFEMFEQGRDGDNAYSLDVLVGGQKVADIAESGYDSRDQVPVTYYTPTNITLV